MDKFSARRIRLRRLIDERFNGVAAALADRVDIAPSSISRMLYDESRPGFKRIGEGTVDKIEAILGIPGWFSAPVSPERKPVAVTAAADADGPEAELIEFGERLAALLDRAGQPRRGAGAYLSKRYKVSNVTANAWLNGEYRPEPDVARRIALDHGSTFEHLYFEPAIALADGDLEERPRTADRVTVSKRDRPDWVDQSDAKAKFWGLVFKLGPTMTDEQAEIACRLLEAIAPAVPAKPADPAPKKRGPAKPKG